MTPLSHEAAVATPPSAERVLCGVWLAASSIPDALASPVAQRSHDAPLSALVWFGERLRSAIVGVCVWS